jgi:hypothetical protein
MEKLTPVELNAKDGNGVSYLIRIHPYRTQENKIEGVVITLLENSAQR